ncbi:MAG: NEL-type E3 ubiquitin ligase domain-containing protein [Candidatus Rhabdochlamydia sp.]
MYIEKNNTTHPHGHQNFSQEILIENLNFLTTLESLPQHIVIKGDVNLDASNVRLFTLLMTKEVEIEGSFLCQNLNALDHESGEVLCFPQTLKVKKDFFISHCHSLTALPSKLKVGGDCTLRYCKLLTGLPSEFEVGKDLELSWLPLQALPSNLKVGGSLDMSKCSQMTSLPPDLEIGNHLNLFKIGLTTFPRGFKVKKNLYVTECKALTSLPSKFEVGKNLYISRCKAFVEFPNTVKIQGFLQVSRCEALTHIPLDIEGGKDLYISHCKSLVSLPKKLHVKGSLIVKKCKALERLPSELEVEQDIQISSCASLIYLPQELKVRRHFRLYKCGKIIHFPSHFKIGKDVDLSYCRALITVSNQFKVRGNLNLSGCKALQVLPNDLEIGNNFDLSLCEKLKALPHVIQLGGKLNVSGCKHLTSLPNWIVNLGWASGKNMRVIDLRNTPLSPQILSRLRSDMIAREELIIHFPQESGNEHPMKFETLLSALEFWYNQDKEAPFRDLEQVWGKINHFISNGEDDKKLLTFLTLLIETTPYSNLATRDFLAQQVIQMIEVMSESEEAYHRITLLIHESLFISNHHLIAVLDTVCLDHKLHRLENVSIPSEEIRRMGRGLFFLRELNKKIQLFLQTLRFVDEVEVYRAFHIRLQEMLELPIQIKKMRFRHHLMISDEEIDQVGKLILETVDETAFKAFLAAWDPWKRHQKRAFSQELIGVEEGKDGESLERSLKHFKHQ